MNDRPLDDPYYARLHLFLNASRSETDRGRALVAASLIEEMLEEVLRAFMLDDPATKGLFDGPNAPLSSLSSKNSACRALGLLLPEEFRDIDLMRKIRNEFAHNVLCSFNDQKIGDWAKALKVGMGILDALPEGDKSRVDDALTRFGMVTTAIVTSLYNRAHYVSKEKLKGRAWPD